MVWEGLGLARVWVQAGKESEGQEGAGVHKGPGVLQSVCWGIYVGEYQGNGIAEALNGRLKIRTTFLVPGQWLHGHAASC